jgi:Fibronectin type III domain
MRAHSKSCVSPARSVSSFLAAAIAAVLPAAALALPPSSQGNPAHGAALRSRYGPPATLTLSQADAFAILGHSCGGIQEHPYVTGFDPATGDPKGAVFLSTSCGGSGHGGHSTTYTAWVGVTWDFSGHVVTYAALSSPPTVDPTFTATDAYEDIIYNTTTAAHLLVPYPGGPVGVTAVQSEDEFQVSWAPTLVNPLAVTSTTVTATPINSSAPVLTTTVVGSTANGTVSPLQPQTTYRITVVNATISGSGPASYPIDVTTSPATEPPGAPTGVSAYWTDQNPSGPTDTFIVTWQAADPGNSPIDQYVIRIVNSETNATTTQTVSGTTLTASFTEDWNPDWHITVQAHNAFGSGPWSNEFTLGGL